jgi:hypothetical protein
MRFGKPSPAMVVAIIAVVVATAGTAFAATGQLVNIVDPGNAARAAKVDSTGKLNVGDGSGPLSVDGTTTSRESPASTLVRGRAIAPSSCSQILAAPAGKALVIKTIHVDTYSNPSPNQGNYVGIYVGASCDSLALFVNPATLGLTSIPLDPGVTVPAGKSLSALSGGSVGVEVYAMGYTVPASSVPAVTGGAKGSDVTQRPGG